MRNSGTRSRAGRAAGLVLAVCAALAAGAPQAAPAEPRRPEVSMYKTPTCGCCGKWAEHLERNGFRVVVHEQADLSQLKRENRIPAELSACHTAFVGGYVIEGHVPAADIARLLAERPKLAGLGVPGMPEGSPGMEGPKPERYRVYGFDSKGALEVFATHGP